MKKLLYVAISFLTISQINGQNLTLQSPLKSIIKDLEIPGMSVAIAKNGKIVYTESLGYADVSNEQNIDSETMFRMASVSKLFAAGAIAKLLDEGKLELNDPVEKYLKDYTHAGKNVTIRRILNHTSGIRHYGKGDRFIDIRNYPTTDDALKIFIDDDLKTEPGTNYQYSTHAFTILAAIVEQISGLPYPKFLEEEFFRPLGMNRSRPDVKGEKDDNQTQLYNGTKKVKMIDNPSYKRAGGGMLSTAEDLVKFGSAHLHPGFFQSSTIDSLFTPSFSMPSALDSTELGMAWRISKDDRGQVYYHHAGNMNGARSFLMISPKDSLSIAIMTNNRNLHMINHLGLMMRDYYIEETQKMEQGTYHFGEDCEIILNGSYPYYYAEISYPSFLKQTQNRQLVAIAGENGTILKNLKQSNEILYVALSEEDLEIVVRDENGQWMKMELQGFRE